MCTKPMVAVSHSKYLVDNFVFFFKDKSFYTAQTGLELFFPLLICLHGAGFQACATMQGPKYLLNVLPIVLPK